MKSQLEKIFPLFLVLVSPALAWSAQLPKPVQERSIETLSLRIDALGRMGNNIYQIANRTPAVLQTPYKGSKATREKTFGKFLDSKKTGILKKLKRTSFPGFFFANDRITILEGESLEFYAYEQKTMQMLSKHTLVWDNIRPPRDSRGEATTLETATMRKKFRADFETETTPRIVGLARLPTSWRKHSDIQLLTLTKAKRYPLAIIRCEEKSTTRCRLARSCYLHGLPSKASELRGLAIDEKSKRFYIGHPAKHRILVGRFSSCYHSKYLGAIELPKQLKELTNLTLDSDRNLWVSTITRDDYFNASVFFWQPDQWLTLVR